MNPLYDALRFGGFVLAHAAWIVSDIEKGDDLLCPIGVVEVADSREVIPFEAASQVEAIRLGKQKMEAMTGSVDRWAFARDGLWSIKDSNSPKQHALTVTAWSDALDEPVLLTQIYSPRSKGVFKRLAPTMIAIHGTQYIEEIHTKLFPIVAAGIAQHPHGGRWFDLLSMEL
jgi:hypothetical protein